ncbi:MAG: hypothetical protein QN187_07710 [Armatimonadota bacterium]|nr:hypothetical protein [Armatimonadota bacterium]MDR7518864.1 hypothetical protein [Armatimonadota bacterium]MDR7549093.1 hypothetical protein [Armatimonadota bacterium]
MYTTGTRGLLWRVQEASGRPSREKLIPPARRIFAAADDGRAVILIPTIVLVGWVFLSEGGIIPGALIDRLLADLGRPLENSRVAPVDLEQAVW